MYLRQYCIEVIFLSLSAGIAVRVRATNGVTIRFNIRDKLRIMLTFIVRVRIRVEILIQVSHE